MRIGSSICLRNLISHRELLRLADVEERLCRRTGPTLQFPQMSHNASAGLLLYRRSGDALALLLAHPGGPFWKNKDAGAWTIPKGLINPDEQPLEAAQREFAEETGLQPQGPFLPLGSVRQKAGKLIHVWAFEGDADLNQLHSNLVPLTDRGSRQSFAEIDRYDWFGVEEAKHKLNPAQAELVDRLLAGLFRAGQSAQC